MCTRGKKKWKLAFNCMQRRHWIHVSKSKSWMWKNTELLGLIGHTAIFLSFHSTVSCRSDISLIKPSCFKRSWRISWTAGKGNKVWDEERERTKRNMMHACIYTVCEQKRKLWNETCNLSYWQTVSSFLISLFLIHLGTLFHTVHTNTHI